jgi:hypothetical protein
MLCSLVGSLVFLSLVTKKKKKKNVAGVLDGTKNELNEADKQGSQGQGLLRGERERVLARSGRSFPP